MANEKPNLSYSDFYTFNSNPTTTVNPAKVGVVWINNKDKKIFICTDNTLNKNKWEETPNMALLEGKVEDALKELEDMVQEIRTYASGLEYRQHVLVGNKTYSWDYDIELELSPDLILPTGDFGAMYRGFQLEFYINNKKMPIAYATVGDAWRSVKLAIKTYGESTVNLYRKLFRSCVDVMPGSGRYRYVDSNIRYNTINEYNYATSYLVFNGTDHLDMGADTTIPNTPITPVKLPNENILYNYDTRNDLIMNGISYLGISSNDTAWVNSFHRSSYPNTLIYDASIPWYIYNDGASSPVDYYTILTQTHLQTDTLRRCKMILTGTPYVIKLKAGDTFRFRCRFSYTIEADRYSERWTGWRAGFIPTGYMAPKPVTYIN